VATGQCVANWCFNKGLNLEGSTNLLAFGDFETFISVSESMVFAIHEQQCGTMHWTLGSYNQVECLTQEVDASCCFAVPHDTHHSSGRTKCMSSITVT